MKRIFRILLAAVILMAPAAHSFAQDARQRTVETIVQDALALMPVQNQTDFDREMEDLAKSAPRSVQLLASMMQPAEKAANNLVEYAISGVVAYASAHPQYKKSVYDALQAAAPKAADETARQFLNSQMRLLGEVKPVEYTAHTGAVKYTELYDKLQSLGDDADAAIAKAVKNKDRAYRMEALKYATDHGMADEALVKKVVKAYSSAKTDGKVDIVNWLGDNKVEAQKPLLVKVVKKGGEPAAAAMEALGRIGGSDACDALLECLGTEQSAAAYTALRSIPDKLDDRLPAVLSKAQGGKAVALLQLASARRIRTMGTQVMALCQSSDPDVAAAAVNALPGVVSKDNAGEIASLLDKDNTSNNAVYAQALASSLGFLSPAEKLSEANALMKNATHKDRFYPIIASTNTKEAVAQLRGLWEKGNDKAALQALKSCSCFEAAAPMLKAAKEGDAEALRRYVALTNDNVTDLDDRCARLVEALGLTNDNNIKKDIIGKLSATPTMPAFINVSKYLQDKELGLTAALAVKDIAGKCVEELDYNQLRESLTAAMENLKSAGGADNTYAIEEIKEMLAKAEPSPVYTLSDEEKKEGFELLFDGTNLDQWTGNKVGYVPVNGTIYVTANYGNESNLYTVKEYRDFVFRFEFCFLRPGVNNGVGIRTPMGVDAAYDGMCEVQILDHDDPIYADLREYQVHGSVYGVIPAKRIKHKPLGEWSTEEIRVQGNHITVTVNGEVILDGDVEEACKGHNVAPDNSDTNPYTVDHRNHPGMFNKTGHIGFLGHGAGLKFRNIRVLDLTKNAAAKSKGKSRR